ISLSESREGQSPDWRILAVAALTTVDIGEAAQRAANLLSSPDLGGDWTPIFKAFLGRTDGATALTKALSGRKLPPNTAKLGLRIVNGAGRPEPELAAALSVAAGLDTEPHQPSPDELQQMVNEVKEKGDPARGEAIFRRQETQCFKCH